MVQWHSPSSNVPWLQFEGTSVDPYYLPGLLWLDKVRPKDLTPLNGLVGQSLQLWSLYKKSYALVPHCPGLASFLGDPRFPSAYNTPKNFSLWTQKGLTTFEALTQVLPFSSFALLQEQYDLPKTEFYKYLQIRHFYTTHYQKEGPSASNMFEQLCRSSSRDKGTISIIYQYPNELDLPLKSQAMLGWEVETGLEISPEDWADMVANLRNCTKSLAIRETVVKLHTRWYYTPARLNKFSPLVPGGCFWGCLDRGTHLHIF